MQFGVGVVIDLVLKYEYKELFKKVFVMKKVLELSEEEIKNQMR